MVDAESIELRLRRIAELIEDLEQVRSLGEDAYFSDKRLRASTEHWFQTAIQACIDIGAHLATELSVEPPSDYAAVFTNLARGGFLDRGLAGRLADAAKQRNVLVHLYLELDDRKVLDSLDRLQDLRDFAAVAQSLVEES